MVDLILQYASLKYLEPLLLFIITKFLFILGTHNFIILGPLASLIAQLVKKLPAVQETLVQSLGPEDTLEKG